MVALRGARPSTGAVMYSLDSDITVSEHNTMGFLFSLLIKMKKPQAKIGCKQNLILIYIIYIWILTIYVKF